MRHGQGSIASCFSSLDLSGFGPRLFSRLQPPHHVHGVPASPGRPERVAHPEVCRFRAARCTFPMKIRSWDVGLSVGTHIWMFLRTKHNNIVVELNMYGIAIYVYIYICTYIQYIIKPYVFVDQMFQVGRVVTKISPTHVQEPHGSL